MMTDELRRAREDEVDAGKKLLFAAQEVYDHRMTDGDFWDIVTEYAEACLRRRNLIEQSTAIKN